MQEKALGIMHQKFNVEEVSENKNFKEKHHFFHLSSFIVYYRWVCVIVAFVSIQNLSKQSGQSYWNSSTILYIVFICTINFFRMIREVKLLCWFLFFDYFFVLLIGYLTPEIIFFEYLFIPLILMDFVVFFPAIPAIVFVVLLGVFGSTGLSNNILLGSYIIINDIKLPVSTVTACFYISISFGLILLAVIKAEKDSQERRFLETVRQNHRMIVVNRNISQRLFSIQQDSSLKERMRIAKKIHDTVGYVFINIIMLLQAALAIIDKDRQKAEIKIGDALDYTRRGMNEIRYILRDIRSYEKPSLGLQNELHDIARLFAKATGVTVNMSYGNWRKSFGTKLDDFFISFLQESFTNALKHGCATVVDMNCWETNREIIIYVQDNGKGTPENLTMGIGISSIKEFVEAQKGHVDIRPSGSGFMIRVTLPLSAIDADDIPEDSRGNFSDVLSSSGIDRPL